ncbi:MAG: hypothetical protein IKF99_03210 [Oscillospiraceae bacterium]|nr:hypothetical protein [Oscillospiraceae bacterium]
MARNDRIKGITIQLDSDTTPLQTALKKVDKSLSETQSNLRDVNKLLKMDPGNITLLKQKQDLLSQAIKDTKEKIDKEKEALQQLKAADQTPEVKKQTEALERQIIADEQALKGFKGQMREFGSVAGQALQAAGEKVKAVGESITAVGQKLAPVSAAAAGIGAGMLKMAYGSVQAADELATTAKQTGFTVEELQRMQYASELVDVSIDDMTGALRKLKPKLTEDNGLLQGLGISVRNVDGSMRPATDVFYDALEALSKIPDETRRDQVAMELFGKRADELAGIIDDGGAALKAYGQEAADAGLILSEDTVSALSETSDTIEKLKADMTGTMAEIGADLAQVLTPVLKDVGEIIKTITARLRELTPEQQATILKIVGVVAALAPVIMIIGQIVSGIGGLISTIGLLMNPVGLTVAGIVAGIAAVVAACVWVSKHWEDIKALAAEIKESVVEAWTKLKEGVVEAITLMKQFVVDTWESLKTYVTDKVTAIKNTVTQKWTEMKTTISNLTDQVKTYVGQKLQNIKQAYDEAGGGIKGIVSATWEGIKSYYQTGFDIIDTLTNGKLTDIKNAFSEKLEAAKEVVRSILEKIKGLFNFNWSLPQLKLPHIHVGRYIEVPVLGTIPDPTTLRVDWYKKAYNNPYLFTSPTIIGNRGFGDGGGSGEIVYGRDQLLRDIAAASTGNVTINVYARDGMSINQLTDAIEDRMTQLQRQRARAYA